MPDFSRRAFTPELMDSAATSFADYRDCLRNLSRVNLLTLGYRPTLHFLDRLADAGRFSDSRPTSIVDVGCGHGDMLRKIVGWAARRRIVVELTGVDADPRAVRAAAADTGGETGIRFVASDVFSYAPPGGIDIVISGLFAHHLDDAALVRFVGWMEKASRIGWFVNDLHRHPIPYVVFRAWSRAAGWHRFVQHDGPVSISRAFDTEDWRRILAAAAVPQGAATIAWWMPFRLCVARVRAE